MLRKATKLRKEDPPDIKVFALDPNSCKNTILNSCILRQVQEINLPVGPILTRLVRTNIMGMNEIGLQETLQ